MAFEPISGTIGAVAFADQMFTRCVWIYKKYKLSQDFGNDYVTYKLKYHCEVFRFEEIISRPHDGLRETVLDAKRQHLIEPLRSRLLLWMTDLQECENLVVKCESKLEQRENDTADDTSEQASIPPTHGTRSPPPPTSTSLDHSALNTLSSSSVSPTASGSLATPSLVVESPVTSAKKSAMLSRYKQKLKHKRDSFLRIFKPRQYKKPFEPDQPPQSPTEQTAPIVDDEHQPVPQVRSRLDSLLPPASAAAASSEITERATEVHDRSNLLHRIGWVAESRSRFIALLGELREHADYFHSMIQLDQSNQMMARSQQGAELRTKVEHHKDIGDRLRMLLQSLHGLPGSNQAVFELMLHNDPLSLQSRYQKESRLFSFRPESAAFHARILPSISIGRIEGSGSPPRVPEPRYLVFDVQRTSASPPIAEGTINTSTGSNLTDLLDRAAKTTRHRWILELGYIRAAGLATGLISVFSDSTIHKHPVTLAECLSDDRAKKFFQVPSQVSFRTRLALVLACSLIYVQRADGLRELNATELTYYDTNPANGQAADLSHCRINPFVQLQMLDVPTATASSHIVLTSAARGDDDETISMIRSLGVLLYEIGSWNVSVGNTVAEKANFVKAKKAALMGTISVKYHDAIDMCLGVRKVASGKLETWIVQNVVGPLEQAQKDVEGLQLVA